MFFSLLKIPIFFILVKIGLFRTRRKKSQLGNHHELFISSCCILFSTICILQLTHRIRVTLKGIFLSSSRRFVFCSIVSIKCCYQVTDYNSILFINFFFEIHIFCNFLKLSIHTTLFISSYFDYEDQFHNFCSFFFLQIIEPLTLFYTVICLFFFSKKWVEKMKEEEVFFYERLKKNEQENFFFKVVFTYFLQK